MSVKTLPVPALAGTLERFLATARPLVDDTRYAQAEEAVRKFAEGEGPRLQLELEEFARQEDEEGRSWLSREWLDIYLRVRDPLPLSTSVGFQIAGDFGAPGLGRAAELVYRAAAVHLAHMRGETPPEEDARGNRVDMQQWDCLLGGVRHPLPERDEIRRPRVAARDAEIGVIHRGRLYVLPIGDHDGRPLPLRTLAEGLRRVVDRDPAPGEPELPFGALSYLGSQLAAPLLEELTQDPRNAEVYERITRMVFVVNLKDTRAEVIEHVERAAFEVGHAWAYKPITYEVGLADDWLAVHVEHSTVDGATILEIVGRIQAQTVPDHAPAEPAGAPEPLTWHIPEELTSRLLGHVANYRRRAAVHGLHRVVVPRPHPAELPFSVSHDSAQQLILLGAQLATYGLVRSVYEAVDMREYQAGRTECLRPVTSEAVEFVAALLRGEATGEQLHAALDAHRGWVKACKTGQGVDRHLLGLELMARRTGATCEFFSDPVLELVRRDFLSTTSIGGAERIVRYAFAPTTAEGFGITYTRLSDGYEFCVNYSRDSSEDLEGFSRNLTVCSELFWEFVAGLKESVSS